MFVKMKVLCIVMCIMLILSACMGTTYTESLSEYLVTDVPLNYSEHVLFPEKDSISEGSINLYRSESKSSIVFDDIYFLLSCSYTDEEYAEETVRLESCGSEYREDLFIIPAYVMLFYGDYYYEYALLDNQSNTIIYISAQTADWSLFESFPEQYLPLNTMDIEICHYQ